MSVMFVVPLPQKFWLIIAPSPWVINERHVLTLRESMYMINEHQNADSSSDDEWASWRGSPSPRKWWLIIAPSPWVINECHVLTLGASMYMIHERQNDDSSSHDEWASRRGSPSPRKWWHIIFPSSWVINERHVLTLGTSMYMNLWASEWWLILRWWMGVMTRVPLPQKMMTHHCPLSMGDKWASCFDTGSSNVHDSWASEWWLILRWWIGVMTWVPLPQKMMTHHCPLSMGDKWASCFDTGSINVHDSWAENDDSSSDDE